MEITIRFVNALDVQRFPKRDGSGEIVKMGIVGATTDKFSKTVKFDVMGEDNINAIMPMLVANALLKVSFDVQSREWNGRWFTELNVWKVEPAVVAQVPQQANAQVQQQYQPQPQPQQVGYNPQQQQMGGMQQQAPQPTDALPF